MPTRWGQIVAGSILVLGATGNMRASDQPSIVVVAYNQARVAADTLAFAKIEVTRIYGDAGVGVTWANGSAVQSTGAFAIQLLLRRRAVNAPDTVMGTAFGEPLATRGSAYVYYERVLRSAHERKQDVARVLAYAIAHEMGHLLLPAPAHAAAGIMRPGWDGDDLRHIASGALRFTAAQEATIRAKASTCCALRAAVDVPGR